MVRAFEASLARPLSFPGTPSNARMRDALRAHRVSLSPRPATPCRPSSTTLAPRHQPRPHPSASGVETRAVRKPSQIQIWIFSLLAPCIFHKINPRSLARMFFSKTPWKSSNQPGVLPFF
jgi:hypothetical protein